MLWLLVLGEIFPKEATDTVGELGIWAGGITAVLVLVGMLIGLGRWVIAAPIMRRVERLEDVVEMLREEISSYRKH